MITFDDLAQVLWTHSQARAHRNYWSRTRVARHDEQEGRPDGIELCESAACRCSARRREHDELRAVRVGHHVALDGTRSIQRRGKPGDLAIGSAKFRDR